MPGSFLFSRDLKNSHALETQEAQDDPQVLLDASISTTMTSHAAATEESAHVGTTNVSLYVLDKRHKCRIYSADLQLYQRPSLHTSSASLLYSDLQL